MAKENALQLIGKVNNLKIDEKNKIATFNMTTIRRNGRIDTPPVLVFENVFGKVKNLKDGDFIIIKGIIGTSETKKLFRCPECGEETIQEALLTTAIAIDVIKLQGDYDINDFKENSNVIYILGTLCRDIKIQTLKSGIKNAQYQMAVNRKLNVREQSDRWTDFPFISSLGEQAEQDYIRMEEGSQCFINGGLQTRTIQKSYECPHCHKNTNIKEEIVEVCPYNVEYLNNCKFSEDKN